MNIIAISDQYSNILIRDSLWGWGMKSTTRFIFIFILPISLVIAGCEQRVELEKGQLTDKGSSLSQLEPSDEPGVDPIIPEVGPDPTATPSPSNTSTPIVYEFKTDTFQILNRTNKTVTVPQPVDILWVIDNSGSMGDDQTKLATGFADFAGAYLTAQYDIRTAAITTDVYLAGNTSNSAYGPNKGALYSRLLPGYADGKRPGVLTGTRSGEPIISTLIPSGYSQESWTSHMSSVFAINAKPGTTGNGNERGMQSIDKFLLDNEERPECRQATVTDSSCLFRKNSARAIVIVSDENDSSTFPGAPVGNSVLDAVVDFNTSYGKSRMDNFFLALDSTEGVAKVNPNYFVSAIINPVLTSPSNCTTSSCASGKTYNALVNKMKAASVNALSSFSSVYDITSASYSGILSTLGQTIISNVSTVVPVSAFSLSAAPVAGQAISAQILSDVGAVLLNVPAADIVLTGNEVRIRNVDFTTFPVSAKIAFTYALMP